MWNVTALVGRIVVVGALTRCQSLHSVYDLKTAQMNVQRHLICEFKLGHDTAETVKNICCAKGERSVDYSTVIKWFKKFRSSCKCLNEHAMTDRPKSEASKAVLKTMEVNQTSNMMAVSGEVDIS